jgi:hypothetical protein
MSWLKYHDREGREIPLLLWAALFEDDDYRIVAETHVNMYRVSTCWFGHELGMGFLTGGPPLIFESMVFGPETRGHAYDCRRYATEAQAKAGHEELVTVIRATAMTVEDMFEQEQETPVRKDEQ